MKLSIKKITSTTIYAAMLVTIMVSASTFTLTQSAHAESWMDRFNAFVSSKKSPTPSASDTAKLQLIISRGDAEINRRLDTLGKLTTLISSSTHLTSADKASLQAEVSSTTSGLTALKAKLDADTTTASARTDANSIYTEYRVYALVVPKIHLIKLADDIQATDAKLTLLASKLQARIDADKTAGKDVSDVQAKLTDLNAQIAAAQNAAGNVETKVIALQPTDYNTDHKVLSGYDAQLKTARSDNQAAYTDAKAITEALKTL